MSTSGAIEKYLDAAVEHGFAPDREQFHASLRDLFHGVELRDKRVLDIGGGNGVHTFYIAACGAKHVVCLEPEAAGSSSGVSEQFARVKAQLNAENAFFSPQTFQDYGDSDPFDVILLNNSVNHLDEPACEVLLHDKAAQRTYQELFKTLYEMTSARGTLIVSDCSRNNFFKPFVKLGIRHPFAPTIEWDKHQAPGTWARLLREVGFELPRTRWFPPNRLRSVGGLLRNPVAAYFLISYFCLTMRKP